MNIRFLLTALLYFALVSSCALNGSHTEQGTQPQRAMSDEKLRRFLGEYLKQEYLTAENVRYFDALADLNGDGKPEIIIHLVGQEICGTGGCPTLVLIERDSTYRVIADISITRLPIRVLAGASNGWRNLGVWVQGGGIQPGYEAELRFDGRGYPDNPTVPPAQPSAADARGEVVISATVKDAKPILP